MGFLQKYDWIEKYIEGKLPLEEKQAFEANLNTDPSFKKEVEDFRLITQQLKTFGEKESLKIQLNKFHEEFEEEAQPMLAPSPKIKKGFWTYYFPTMATAACVALVTAISILWMRGNMRSLEDQQASYYKELKKDLDRVKITQKTIVASQVSEKTKLPPPFDYSATAFAIAPEGYLVTNYHVIRNASSMYVESKVDSLKRYKVKEVYSDPSKDLAILQIVDSTFKNFTSLPYSFRNQNADLGESVYTLAYPREDMVYGEGSISSQTGFEGDTMAYQISIPVNPGNSGSPVIDEKGNIIGIVTGKSTATEGAAFAIKIKHVTDLVASLKAKSNQDEPSKNIKLPYYNSISYLKRPQQIKKIRNFVFVLKVYKGTE